jgi:hypothetical protein
VETASLWHYMFWSLASISVQGGLGPCATLCRVSEPAEYSAGYKNKVSDLSESDAYCNRHFA